LYILTSFAILAQNMYKTGSNAAKVSLNLKLLGAINKKTGKQMSSLPTINTTW